MGFWDCHFGTVAKSIIAVAFWRQESTKKIEFDDGLFSYWLSGGKRESSTLAFKTNMYNTCIVEHLRYTPIDLFHSVADHHERDIFYANNFDRSHVTYRPGTRQVNTCTR
jgi:hypothetical protein